MTYFAIIVKIWYNNMVSIKRKFGDMGERIAKKYLESQKYLFIDQNYSKRWGEIDLIFTSPEGELVFVEIKTREVGGFGQAYLPEDSVNFSKRQKLIKTAQTYLYEYKYDESTFWRIDVVAIEINNTTRKAKIRHLKNAVEMQ